MEKRDLHSDSGGSGGLEGLGGLRGETLRPWSGIFGDRLIVAVIVGAMLLFLASWLLIRYRGVESELAALCGCGGLVCIGVVFVSLLGKLLIGKLDTNSFWAVLIFVGMMCAAVVFVSKNPMVIGIFLFVAAMLAAMVIRLKSLERSMTKRFSWRVSTMLNELNAADQQNGGGAGGRSPWDGFFEVVSSGDLPRLEELLAADPEAVFRKDRRGNTLLHSAAVCGYADVVARLVEAGAPVNERNGVGRTPLHCAALSVAADEEILCSLAAFLLDHGGDGAAVDNDGATARAYAEKRTDRALAEFLKERGLA